MKEMQLVENVRIKIGHSCQVKKGTDVWRVIVNFISDFPDKDRLIKEYFVWVTDDYLEDKAGLIPNLESAEKFALIFVKKRFIKSSCQVPIENGVTCSVEGGVAIIDPKNYIHPVEKNE